MILLKNHFCCECDANMNSLRQPDMQTDNIPLYSESIAGTGFIEIMAAEYQG